jgi:hypothetical protein
MCIVSGGGITNPFNLPDPAAKVKEKILPPEVLKAERRLSPDSVLGINKEAPAAAAAPAAPAAPVQTRTTRLY